MLVHGVGMEVPRHRYRVIGTVAASNMTIPSPADDYLAFQSGTAGRAPPT